MLERKNEAEKLEFVLRLVSAMDEAIRLVANRLGWSRAEYAGVKKGSFNGR